MRAGVVRSFSARNLLLRVVRRALRQSAPQWLRRSGFHAVVHCRAAWVSRAFIASPEPPVKADPNQCIEGKPQLDLLIPRAWTALVVQREQRGPPKEWLPVLRGGGSGEKCDRDDESHR